jgi:hypothetical protein
MPLKQSLSLLVLFVLLLVPALSQLHAVTCSATALRRHSPRSLPALLQPRLPRRDRPLPQSPVRAPRRPSATTFLLEAEVFAELYRQDLLDTTFYANDGFLTGKHPTPENNAVRDRIFSLEDQVEREAGARLEPQPRDTDALYARGWARSLRSAYMAMIERSFSAAFHMALQAHSDEAKVLQIDPDYHRCQARRRHLPVRHWRLALGLQTALRFRRHHRLQDTRHGDAPRRLRHGPMTSTEAGTVITLFLRREAKYQEAWPSCASSRRSTPTISSSALKKPTCAKTQAKAWPPSPPTRIC